jgi:hypothetical protein
MVFQFGFGHEHLPSQSGTRNSLNCLRDSFGRREAHGFKPTADIHLSVGFATEMRGRRCPTAEWAADARTGGVMSSYPDQARDPKQLTTSLGRLTSRRIQCLRVAVLTTPSYPSLRSRFRMHESRTRTNVSPVPTSSADKLIAADAPGHLTISISPRATIPISALNNPCWSVTRIRGFAVLGTKLLV